MTLLRPASGPEIASGTTYRRLSFADFVLAPGELRMADEELAKGPSATRPQVETGGSRPPVSSSTDSAPKAVETLEAAHDTPSDVAKRFSVRYPDGFAQMTAERTSLIALSSWSLVRESESGLVHRSIYP
jgi:hypothetical protein